MHTMRSTHPQAWATNLAFSFSNSECKTERLSVIQFSMPTRLVSTFFGTYVAKQKSLPKKTQDDPLNNVWKDPLLETVNSLFDTAHAGSQNGLVPLHMWLSYLVKTILGLSLDITKILNSLLVCLKWQVNINVIKCSHIMNDIFEYE